MTHRNMAIEYKVTSFMYNIVSIRIDCYLIGTSSMLNNKGDDVVYFGKMILWPLQQMDCGYTMCKNHLRMCLIKSQHSVRQQPKNTILERPYKYHIRYKAYFVSFHMDFVTQQYKLKRLQINTIYMSLLCLLGVVFIGSQPYNQPQDPSPN